MNAAPVVVDSPHSGADYPVDFDFVCDVHTLRQAEDAYVDLLVSSAPDHGASLLSALFPRTYIDPNRALSDMDRELLTGPWPETAAPGEKAWIGQGLVRSIGRPGEPLYNRRLSPAEVRRRVSYYYQPYHDALAAMMDETHRRFGVVYHLNCHSMPSLTGAAAKGKGASADFVLGDRDGTTCEPGFMALVEETLRRRSYTVVRNDPYKGVEIVRRYGRPAARRHALQLEISRRLYMNERTLETVPNFETLRTDLSDLIAAICAYAHDQAAAKPA